MHIQFNAILSNNRPESPFIKKRKRDRDREQEFDYSVIFVTKGLNSFLKKRFLSMLFDWQWFSNIIKIVFCEVYGYV